MAVPLRVLATVPSLEDLEKEARHRAAGATAAPAAALLASAAAPPRAPRLYGAVPTTGHLRPQILL